MNKENKMEELVVLNKKELLENINNIYEECKNDKILYDYNCNISFNLKKFESIIKKTLSENIPNIEIVDLVDYLKQKLLINLNLYDKEDDDVHLSVVRILFSKIYKKKCNIINIINIAKLKDLKNYIIKNLKSLNILLNSSEIPWFNELYLLKLNKVNVLKCINDFILLLNDNNLIVDNLEQIVKNLKNLLKIELKILFTTKKIITDNRHLNTMFEYFGSNYKKILLSINLKEEYCNMIDYVADYLFKDVYCDKSKNYLENHNNLDCNYTSDKIIHDCEDYNGVDVKPLNYDEYCDNNNYKTNAFCCVSNNNKILNSIVNSNNNCRMKPFTYVTSNTILRKTSSDNNLSNNNLSNNNLSNNNLSNNNLSKTIFNNNLPKTFSNDDISKTVSNNNLPKTVSDSNIFNNNESLTKIQPKIISNDEPLNNLNFNKPINDDLISIIIDKLISNDNFIDIIASKLSNYSHT